MQLSEATEISTEGLTSLPPLKIITVDAGTLLGFKACPGVDASILLNHASSSSSSSSSSSPSYSSSALWSAIYIQLSLAQAISYVPNQYERGEEVCCVCRVTVRDTFQIAVLDDPRMTDPNISSKDKAEMVQNAVARTPALQWSVEGEANEAKETETPPVLQIFGEHRHALCLLDCENYELALPHCLFSTVRLALECLFVFPVSTTILGGVIGGIYFVPSNPNEGEDEESNTTASNTLRSSFEQLLPQLSKWELD